MDIINSVTNLLKKVMRLLGIGNGKTEPPPPSKPIEKEAPAIEPPPVAEPAPAPKPALFDQVPPVAEPMPAPEEQPVVAEAVAEAHPATEEASVPQPVPFDQVPPVAEPTPAPEEQPVVAESVPASEEQPTTEPAPVVEPEAKPDFKDTPEKKALDELILATLREFQEQELAKQGKLSVANFSQFFERKNRVSIKNAIRQASAKCGLPPPTLIAKLYFALVPGVEVYEEGLLPCVCLAGTPIMRKASANRKDSQVAAAQKTLIPSRKSLLHDIRMFASWDGVDGQKQLEAAKNMLKKHYPDSIGEGESREKEGRKLKTIFADAYKAGSSGKPFDIVREMLKTANVENPFETEKARKQYDRGVAAHKRWAETMAMRGKMKSVRKSGPAVVKSVSPAKTSVVDEFDKMFGPMQDNADQSKASPLGFIADGNANVLSNLDPSDEWTVMIDDTGKDFSGDATGKTRGRMIAVFIPKERPLENLSEGWHAVDKSLKGPEGVLDVIGRMQNARCGIVGIPITVLPYTTQEDQWFSCLEDLVALSLRILPVRGKTKISLFVEQSGSAEGWTGTTMLEKTVEDVLHRLAFVFPERARNITVNGKIITKEEHPWNGYADAAAFTWGSSTMEFLLNGTGWLETCFIDRESAALLKRALDALRSEDVPDAKDWRKLLSLVAADNEASLVSALLRALGQEAQADTAIWKVFLDEAVRHLDSKAIDMALLGRQLKWLKKWQPADAELPPRMRLMWLVSQLAAANHSGHTDLHETDAFRKEFDELADRLYREDCPLVSHAKLHLAVSYTNAFEFEKARDLLLPMRGWPVEGMGLRMEGRLLSSLGQHEAFLGNPVGALPLFDEAISLFRDLSENFRLDIIQTSAYAATAAMDAKTPDADARLATYIWNGPFSEDKLVSEARRLAASAEPVEKYAHHILLRRLVELPADHPARAAYLAEKPRWAEPAVGHPWELIEFYRALLLPSGDERKARLESACDLAIAEGGATLQVIAAVIRSAALCEDPKADLEAYGNLVACCAEALPALGEARLAALRGQLDPATRLAPLDLAKAVLPFNFR